MKCSVLARTVRPDWALCDDHVQKRIDRALGVKATAPHPDLPRLAHRAT